MKSIRSDSLAFEFKSLINVVLIFMFPFFFLVSSLLAQQNAKTKVDTLKSVLPDSALKDSSKIKGRLLNLPSVPMGPELKKTVSDTIQPDEDWFEDDSLTIPTPFDTTNKIRLPVDLKKKKYAYFDASQSITRVVTNHAFGVGEKLIFDIRYGPVVAGSSTMSIPAIERIKGNECYKIVTEARSSSFFSTFFKVRDRVESYVDREGLFTWQFEKHLREGKYHADRFVEYNQIEGWAVSNKKDSMRIPPCIQDVLSSFYYVRTQKLEVGQSLFIDNHGDNKLYPLEVKVYKKERIRVKAGEFDCIVVEPVLRVEGLFKSKGRLLIWLTDDRRKIPIQMKSKIIVGFITAELKQMEGIKGGKRVDI